MNFKVYQKLENSDIVGGKNNVVSSGFFPGGQVYFNQSLFTSSSIQTRMFGNNSNYDVLNGLYYTNVYNDDTVNPQLLFSIAYGDLNGLGSKSPYVLETKTIYSQYKNTLLGISDSNGVFNFLTGSISSNTYETSSKIYALNFSSQLKRNQIDPGQWTLTLPGNESKPYINLIDDSCLTGNKKQNVYQIIEGTFNSTTGITEPLLPIAYNSIGLFYPVAGVIILNPNALARYNPASEAYSINYILPPSVPYHKLLLDELKKVNDSMRVRKSEIIPSIHYWIRVKNTDFNFSNNPSFIYQESDGIHMRGDIIEQLVSNPATYVTTVGLYNDLNELVAVAKLSRPVRKDFTSEILIRIRLDC